MAVQVLVDHGVPQAKIVFVTYFAGRMGLMRLTKVFPEVRVVVCTIVADYEERVCTISFYPNPYDSTWYLQISKLFSLFQLETLV